MDQCEFECPECLTKVIPKANGTYKTEFQSVLQVPCNKLPPRSTNKTRYLRRDKETGQQLFKTFTYIYYPCSLPSAHTSPHYYHYTSTYTEEFINTGSLPVTVIEDGDIV
jgi:hypothetical protein